MELERIAEVKKGLHWYHWLVIVSSLLLTLTAWNIAREQQAEKIEQRFDFQSEQLLALIIERMSRYEDALRAGVAKMVSAGGFVDVYDWQKFADSFHLEETYPGINGIGVIFFVPEDKRESFLAEQRRYRPDFIIKPEHDNNEYWPITYVEPVNINQQAVGLDMAFEENRWTAAKASRDTGETRITRPIVLVQDERRTPGFLQYVPFYRQQNLTTVTERRENFIGHVYAPFIMHKLIEGTLEQKNRRLLFSVFDEQDELYSELHSNMAGVDQHPLFEREVTVDVYGRPWRFTIQTAQSFRDTETSAQPIIILIGGLVIDAMLIVLFLMMVNSQRNAVFIAREMTQKHIASQTYYSSVIQAAPCGILIVNDQGIIEQVNPELERLLGYTASELVGRDFEIMVPNEYRAKHRGYADSFRLQNVARQMGANAEIYCLNKQQQRIPVQIGLANFEPNSERKTIATVVDISENVKVTDELRRSNKELDEFAYVASHDLKAPLRGIIQLSNWISEDIGTDADPEILSNLALLKNRSERLDKLLDDLLAYSRIGRKQDERAEVNVKAMITNLMDLLDPKGDITLNFQERMPVFETDSIPLETIFRNLLNNAIKHADNGLLVIGIGCREFNDHYEFSISDNGPGIAPEHHDQIFHLFKTLRPRDEVEGSGMGLSIIKKIIDSFGQQVEVDSDGRSGTTFRFTWPK